MRLSAAVRGKGEKIEGKVAADNNQAQTDVSIENNNQAQKDVSTEKKVAKALM